MPVPITPSHARLSRQQQDILGRIYDGELRLAAKLSVYRGQLDVLFESPDQPDLPQAVIRALFVAGYLVQEGVRINPTIWAHNWATAVRPHRRKSA